MSKYRVWIHYSKGEDDEYIEFSDLGKAIAFSNQKITGERHEKPLRIEGRGLLNSKEFNIPRNELKSNPLKKFISDLNKSVRF
jgi:hypothetical protein